MIIDQVILFLTELFSQFVCHSRLLDELADFISGSGYEKAFFKQLQKRLYQLSAFNLHAVQLEEFEPLGDGLYSMHLAGKNFNIRILYCFLPNSQPALLLAFYERGNKKKTDYTSHIPTAKDRKAEMEAQYNHDKK